MCEKHSPAPHPGEGSRRARGEIAPGHVRGPGEDARHGSMGGPPSASEYGAGPARGPVTRAAERAILFYRSRISPAKGTGSCRFEPTCSAYGLVAVRRFGAARGLWLTFLRIARCAPWHPGGWDPVPRTFPGLASWWRRMHG